jgi:hypothetical protein
MPGGDRTGPMGEGPMTGRGAGFCTGNSQAGYSSSFSRLGLGLRRGRGFMMYPQSQMQMGQYSSPTLMRPHGGGGFFRRGGGGRGRGRRFRQW